VCRRTGHTMVGVRLLPLPQHLIHLSSQFAAPKPNLPILGSYGFRSYFHSPFLDFSWRYRDYLTTVH
jgi:hypothetical protein